MNIKITKHVLLRMYERFYFLKNVDSETLENEIKNDLKNYEVLRTDRNNVSLVKANRKYYIVEITLDEITVITVMTHLYINISNDKISIQSKLKIDKSDISIISKVLNHQEQIIIKKDGSKYLCIVDEFLLLIREDTINNFIHYNILDKYNVKDLFNIELIDKIKEKYFSDCNISTWEKFASMLQLNKFIFQVQQREILTRETEISIYLQVLEGCLKKFPPYFWQDDIGGTRCEGAAICTRYMIENILEWTLIDISNKITSGTFIKHKLNGMLQILFKGSVYLAIDNAYPNIFKPWSFKKVEDIKYWQENRNNTKALNNAIDWLISESQKDGYNINQKNIFQFDWISLLRKYNLLQLFTVGCNSDYMKFFKNCFSYEFNDIDILRYVTYYETKTHSFMKNHR